MGPLVTITRRIEWDMAHRLGKDYPGKCAKLHGHRYVAEASFTCAAFSKHEMVIDLGRIKDLCKGWIDEKLDHGTIVSALDDELYEFLVKADQKYYMFPFATTVEMICPYLAEMFQELVDGESDLSMRGVSLKMLKLYETPNGFATWLRRDERDPNVGNALKQCDVCLGTKKLSNQVDVHFYKTGVGASCPNCAGKGYVDAKE